MVDWLIGILKYSAIVLYRLFVLDPFSARLGSGYFKGPSAQSHRSDRLISTAEPGTKTHSIRSKHRAT
jgi:hypothetical protein